MVKIDFGGQEKSATADDNGHWLVKLDPLKADATGRDLTISAGDSITLKNVLVGEVWVCSGQSNMQMLLGKSEHSWIPGGVKDFDKEIADSNYPQIRMLTVPFDDKTMVFEPKQDSGGTWIVCSPETSGHFAAIPFFFGRALTQKLGEPIGLVNVTLGGSCLEAWISNDTARHEPCMQDAMTAWDAKWADYQKNAANTPPPPSPLDHRATPTVLFNGMLAPIIPYAMKGVIFYQGETNAPKPDAYADRFQAMIRDWRQHWGEGEFPFLYVQLAPMGGESYSRLREAQRQALAVPNTAMAVSSDLDAGLHPIIKQPIGERLALAARALAYGEKIEYSGPLALQASVADGNVRVTFSHTGSGLVTFDSGSTPRLHPGRRRWHFRPG